ncbi:MAG: YggT family protein [Desulfotomaculaceae bacterium]|nr:YggT family protein [Desulfotomaculaceae bacterium]
MGIIITAVNVAFEVYTYLIIIRILLSWVRHNPYQPLIRFIYEITDPYLNVFKRFIPPFGAMDFSPIVAFFVLQLLRNIVIKFLLFLL